MQKKKLFLSLFALCSIVGMGITSCNNQGEQGPIGPEGPEGPAGENGEDGQDGSLILTGEGKPEDTLGKDSDIYIDSKTGDLYQKENGTWTLVMNIKGEDGEDGSSGSSGSDGQTAWSNTILPTEGGYLTTSIGSGVVGTTFTVNAYPNSGHYLDKLEVVDKDGNTSSLTFTLDETTNVVVSESITMKEGGYVIAASFKNLDELGDSAYVDGTRYLGTFNSVGEFVPDLNSKVEDAPKFEDGNGEENDPLIIKTADQLSQIASAQQDEETMYFSLSGVEGDSLTVSTLLVGTNNKDKNIVLDLSEKTLNSSEALTALDGSSVSIKNGTIGSNGGLFVYNDADLTLENIDINSFGIVVGPGANQGVDEVKNINIKMDGVNIKDSVMPFSTNASLFKDDQIENVNIDITNSSFIAEAALHDNAGFMVNIPATVNISNSTIKGQRQALIVRAGDVTLDNVKLEYEAGYFYNPTDDTDPTFNDDPHHYGNKYGDGNRVATAGIVIGDKSTSAYPGPASLTMKNVSYVRTDIKPSEGEGETTTRAARTEPYDIYMFGESDEYNATLNIDSTTLSQFDETNICKNDHSIINILDKEPQENVYHNGVYYSKLYLNDNGEVNNLSSVKGSNITFAGGSNTAEDPLIVNTKGWTSQPQNMFTSSTGKYFKLNGNFSLTTLTPDNKLLACEKVIDLDGNTLTISNANSFGLFVSQGSKVTFKNGTIISKSDLGFAYMGKNTDESFTGGELTLENITLEAKTTAIGISSKDSTLNIIDSTIKAGSTAIGTNATLGEKVTNVNINIDNSKIITDGSSDTAGTKDSMAMLVTVNANVNIKNNSYIEGTKQSLIVRGGNVTISDSTIAHSHTYSGDELYLDGDWGSGNAVPYSAIVVGDTSTTSYNYDATLTLTNVKFVDNGEQVEGRFYYQIYVYDDGTYKATLNIDEASYATFDHTTKIYVKEGSELSTINVH